MFRRVMPNKLLKTFSIRKLVVQYIGFEGNRVILYQFNLAIDTMFMGLV